MDNTTRIVMATVFIFAVSLLRLLPHPPNLVPMTAICLFAGAQLRSRTLQFVTPLAAILLTDGIQGTNFTLVSAFVLLSYMLIVAAGRFVTDRRLSRLLPASAFSTLLFFTLSNFGFWCGTLIYPRTINGLVTCYVNAIPFLWNSLIADAFYVVAVFAGFSLLEVGCCWITGHALLSEERNVHS